MSVNEPFIGMELGTLNADKFTESNIEAKERQEDLALFDTKWFDYRLWHPAKATMYFAHRYNVIAEEYVKRYFGEEAAATFRRQAGHFDLRKKSLAHIRGFWRARQQADAIGCTYDVYIRGMLDSFHAKYNVLKTTKTRGRGGRKQMAPYPQQMYGDDALEHALKMWERYQQRQVPMPESEYFLENTTWFDDEMEAFVRAKAATWPNPEAWIAKAIRNGVIKQANEADTISVVDDTTTVHEEIKRIASSVPLVNEDTGFDF